MRQVGELVNMLMVTQQWDEAVSWQQTRLQHLVPPSLRTIVDIAAMEQFAEVLKPWCHAIDCSSLPA